MTAPMLMSWCSGDPCDPCAPPITGSWGAKTTTGVATSYNACLVGDTFTQYSTDGGATWHSGTPPNDPSTGAPPVGWTPKTANSDPLVKYGVKFGAAADLPVYVNNVFAGNLTGGSAGHTGNYEPSIAPGWCASIHPGDGTFTGASQDSGTPISVGYPHAGWYLMNTFQDLYTVKYSISIVSGTYPLNPAHNDLYAEFGKTDPIYAPGGPQLPIVPI